MEENKTEEVNRIDEIRLQLLEYGWDSINIQQEHMNKGNGLLNKPVKRYTVQHDGNKIEHIAVKISEREPRLLFRHLYQKYGHASQQQLEKFDLYCPFLSISKMPEREYIFYQNYNQCIARFLPKIYGMSRTKRGQMLIMEDLSGCDCMDQIDNPQAWEIKDVELVVKSLVFLHYTDICHRMDVSVYQSKENLSAIADFLEELNGNMRTYVKESYAPVILAANEYIYNLQDYEAYLCQYRQTVIHNDFNIRNICIDRKKNQLKIYDWEFLDYKNPIIDIVDLLLSLSSQYLTGRWIERWLSIYISQSQKYTNKKLDLHDLKEQLYYNAIKFAATRMNMYGFFYARKKESYILRMYQNLMLIINYCCKL